MMNTAAPTTHTHGCVYHVVVVFVVSFVTDVLELELDSPLPSWAHITNCIRLKMKTSRNLLIIPSLAFFIFIGLKK